MDNSGALDSYIQDHLDPAFADLARLVRQPSISSQNVGIRETAELVAALLEEHGFNARVMETPGHPIVYGEARGSGDRTLLCYNHYDVQPAEPLELWDSPPFQMTERDGKLYGRGVADDKGHIASRLAALDAVRAQHGGFPCAVKFVIEGGEEVSSPHVPEFVEENAELLSADACVWETGGVDYQGRPQLMLGMRGICYVEYRARTMNRDAHSGSAHLLPNAAWALVRALNSIKDENEHIKVPGFYDDVCPPSQIDLELLEELDSDEELMKAAYGIPAFNLGLTGLEARKAVFSPTANIAGFESGYTGAGPKTVIPSTAMAKMDFRLVPDQDPEDIVARVQTYLDSQGYDIEVRYLGGERAAQTPVDDPFVQLTARVAEEVYGNAPRITPLVGGSGPMHPFRDVLNVPIVTVGVGYPGTQVHAPNENIVVENFVSGTRHMAHLVERFSR